MNINAFFLEHMRRVFLDISHALAIILVNAVFLKGFTPVLGSFTSDISYDLSN